MATKWRGGPTCRLPRWRWLASFGRRTCFRLTQRVRRLRSPTNVLVRLTLPMKQKVLCREIRSGALGGVDSRDSLLGANQIQGCFWGGSLGCDGTVGFERRGVGADSAADHRPA